MKEADEKIIKEIVEQKKQKVSLDKLNELIEQIDKYMNEFEFKYLKVEAEKNAIAIKQSQFGNNEFKPIESCDHLKQAYPSKKSGYYWIKDKCMKDPLRMFCNFNLPKTSSYSYVGYTE